jgi:hypothetical protein
VTHLRLGRTVREPDGQDVSASPSDVERVWQTATSLRIIEADSLNSEIADLDRLPKHGLPTIRTLIDYSMGHVAQFERALLLFGVHSN